VTLLHAIMQHSREKHKLFLRTTEISCFQRFMRRSVAHIMILWHYSGKAKRSPEQYLPVGNNTGIWFFRPVRLELIQKIPEICFVSI